jgi:hypothetical protein
MPVQQGTTIELLLNLKTARTPGRRRSSIPPTM